MAEISAHHQLELIGLDEARRLAEQAPTKAVRTRMIRKIEVTHELLSELPGDDDLAFNHSGMCQTFLPHARLANNQTAWKRQSGRFILMVTPGVMPQPDGARAGKGGSASDDDYVGVPYGAKARLIMFHLQTEGRKSPIVPLGKNLSAFLRSLNLVCSGGPRGNIVQVREQCLRIARCTFSLRWTEMDHGGDERIVITDTKIIDGMELWNANSDDWSATVQLGDKFHAHLVEHAVPLDKRAIALLAGNSLGLDLYALFTYRLPKLRKELLLTWDMLQDQIGSQYTVVSKLSSKVRDVMPEVARAYPHAGVEVRRNGLLLKPSKPSVPHTMVNGYRLIEGACEASSAT